MHFKNSVLLFLVVQFAKHNYSLSMEDVCSADDDTCMKPKFSGVSMIEKGKCSLTGVLLRFHQLSLLECAKECFVTSQCTSINYKQNWKLCDLVMSNDKGNEIADDSTCIKSNITTWQKSLAGKCTDHICEAGQQCIFIADEHRLECVEAYCKGLPITPNATVDEQFGLRRNIDTGNKYKCYKDYKMEGNPFAVCKSPGHWKVLFNCTPIRGLTNMNLRQSILLDIIHVLAITSSLNMKDVCPADNVSCEEPNISGPGLLKFSQCSKIGVLLRYNTISLLECVKECLITSQCMSINYRQNWNLCDVVTSVSNSNDMDNDTTCVTSDISTWEKSFAGICVDHTCAEGSKCQFDHVTSDIVCIDVYCKDMSSIPNAETVEPFGLQRQYNIGNKYACKDNFKMQGRPFSVCQNPGGWKVLFTCVYECNADGLQIEEETTSCIKHITTTGSTWKEARTICQQQGGDLVSIVSKEKWDSVMDHFRSVGHAWIGLKDKRWMTGESFNNAFEIKIQLNDYDRDYPKEDENTCGIIALSSSIPLQDENCNIRKRENFFCEIPMLQN